MTREEAISTINKYARTFGKRGYFEDALRLDKAVKALTAEWDAAVRDDTTTVTRDVCYNHGEITNYGAESCDKCGAKQPDRYPHCPGCGRRIER